MLGKLFKHEFKETGKLLIPLNLVIICYTVIGAIMLGSRLFDDDHFALLAASSLILYILSIFAIFIVTFIFFTVRFYKTMYSSQGYLTHTLPVSTGSIIHTKVLVSVFWVVVTMAVTMFSVFAMVAVTIRTHLSYDSFNSFFMEFFMEFNEEFGMSFGSFLLPIMLLIIVGCFEGMLTVYASLSIGQLFNQYRILAAIVTYVIIHIAVNIMGTVTMFITEFSAMDSLFIAEEFSDSVLGSFYHTLFSVSNIEHIILCIIFYAVLYFLTTRKLNLE